MDEITKLIELKRLLLHFGVEQMPTVSIAKSKLKEICHHVGHEFHDDINPDRLDRLMGFDVRRVDA